MDIKWWEGVEYYLTWALASSRRLAHRRRIMARYVFMGVSGLVSVCVKVSCQMKVYET
jgi:hypothetical protein